MWDLRDAPKIIRFSDRLVETYILRSVPLIHATSDPECKWTESALAKKLGVIRQTVNAWISDIRARQKASRNTVILRLSRLGWPQEKISETVGLSQNRVSEIIGNANFGNIDTLFSQGHDMEYIARHYNRDLRDVRSERSWRAG